MCFAIPASSAASKRVFPVAGNDIVIKKHNRLGDDSVDDLVFAFTDLRNHVFCRGK